MLRWVEQVRRIGESNILGVEVAAVRDGLVRAGDRELTSALETLPVVHLPSTNEIRVGSVRGAELVPEFRAGNLNLAFERAGSTIRVSPTLERTAKNLFARSMPDVEISRLETDAARIKTANPDLNIEIRTAADYNSLPESTRAKIERAIDSDTAWRNGKRIAIAFTVLAGGTILAEILAQAVRDRNGCWAVQTREGESFYCKLNRRSCLQTGGNNSCGSSAIVPTAGNLFTFVAAAYSNDALKQSIEAQIKQPITFDNIGGYVQRYGKELQQLVKGHNFDTDPDPCVDAVHNNTPYPAGCVQCDPSASVNSRQYLDTSTLPPNLTYKCIKGSTLADVLADLGVRTLQIAKDVFSGITNFIWWGLGALVVVLVLVLALRNSGTSRQTTSQPNQGSVYSGKMPTQE